MSKKILLSLAIIGVAAAMVVGATTAYFSDTAESEGNTFTSGDLVVSIGENKAQDFPVSFTNMEPGVKTGLKKFYFRNTGSLPQTIDSITVSGLEENDKKVISECFDTNDHSDTTDCENIHGNVMMDADYNDTWAVYNLTIPGIEQTDGDNFDLTFDSDNDGTADFQVKYQKGNKLDPDNHRGHSWHYAPVEDGSWDKWQDVPGDFDVSRNGDKFTIKIPVDELGGSDSEYRLGLQGHWNGDYPESSGHNAVFQYPNYFSWGENSVGSEDYKPMDTGDVDKNADNVARNINVWAYKGDTTSQHIWKGTLYELADGSDAIPNTADETDVDPSEHTKYQFKFQLDPDVSNDYQGDGVDATFEVEATQE